MNSDNQETLAEEAVAPRKPRLALMGEFSAGKSTLSNLLLGADPLPVKVTATRLPPIWVSYGTGPACREDTDGNLIPIDVTQLESVPLEETKLIRLFLESDVLRLCDLIDMPGISDPNMAAEVWQGVIGEADNVVWCTHATQAWRQSEAAVWETLLEELRDKSLLLLTRFDKLLSDRDRNRVLARVRRETAGLFSDMYPVCLTEALIAGEDRAKWEHSGAQAFVERLIDLLVNPDAPARGTYGDIEPMVVPASVAQSAQQPRSDAQVKLQPKPRPNLCEDQNDTATVRVMPSRVRARQDGQKRPRRVSTNA